LKDKSTLTELKEVVGFVSNIQRFSLHDGPGIRTLVFMQGCPLKCKWCCNPEGQKSYPQLRLLSVKCPGKDTCNATCVEACPEAAISISEKGKPKIDWKHCTNCGKCAEICLYEGLTMLGKKMTVEEVLHEVEKDRAAYRKSGGGVTIGGGEPLAQFDYVLALLRRCKERYLHTAMETCGHAPWEYLEGVSEYLDFMYYDVKHMDPERHKELTGVSNELILSNARKILTGEVKGEVVIRTEVIPGCNDSEEEISAIAKFVSESGGKMMELLPYHALGSSKYGQLGMRYKLPKIKPPTDEQMERLKDIVRSFGLKEMTGVL
jgi:pyruvate formate lyase activating enzyme